ncbi:MAG: long-chain fatty acid--CoA ligase, partial [Dethiosulfovibrio sp.]|nr:long-chain fatty acid--CoA ligase [Dethiosulfovibrio sp.]
MNRVEQVIKERCEVYPDSPCLFFEGVTWTRRELDQAADRCEASLVSAGFTGGQRLVTMMPNCPAV